MTGDASAPPAPPRPPDRPLLETLYEDPVLDRAHGGAGSLEALFEWLRGLLDAFLGTRVAEGFAAGGRLLFFVLAALLALLVLAFVLRRLPGRRPRGKGPTASGPSRLASPQAHRALADAAKGRGDLREAARQRFLSVLAELEAARLVGYGRHKTNREYVTDLERRGAPADLKAAFGGLVDRFDAAWYGLRAFDDETTSAIDTACDRVLDAMATLPPERRAA